MQLDPNDIKKTINNAAHSFQEKAGKKGKTASSSQGGESLSPDRSPASGQDDSAEKNGSSGKLTRRQKKSRRSRRSRKAANAEKSARSGQTHQGEPKEESGKPHQDAHPAEPKAESGKSQQNAHPVESKAEPGRPHQNAHPAEPKEEPGHGLHGEKRAGSGHASHGGQTKLPGALKATIAEKTKKGLFPKKEKSPEIQVPDTEETHSQKKQDKKDLWSGPAQKISDTVRKIGIIPARRKASEDGNVLREADASLPAAGPDLPETSGSERAKTHDPANTSDRETIQDRPKTSDGETIQDRSKTSDSGTIRDRSKTSDGETIRERSKSSRRARKKGRSKRADRAKAQDRSKASEPLKTGSLSTVSEPVKDSGKTPDHMIISGAETASEAETLLPQTSPEPLDISQKEPAFSAQPAVSVKPAAAGETPAAGEEAAAGSPVPEKETAPENGSAPEGKIVSGGMAEKSESFDPEAGAALPGEEMKTSEETSDGALQKTDSALPALPVRAAGTLRNLWVLCVTWWKALYTSLVKKVGYTLAAAGVIAFVAALFCCVLYLSTMGSRSGQTVDSGGKGAEEMAPEEGAEADYDGIAPADETGTTGWSQVLPDQSAGTEGDQALAKAFEGLFSRTREAAVVLRQQAVDTIREEYMEILESGRGSDFKPESEAQKKLWKQVRHERKKKLKEEPLLILVNKWHTLPEDYVVEPVDLENGQQISSICYDQMVQMLQDCRNAGGTPIVCSGYRPHETQVYLFDQQINRWLYMGYGQEEAEAMAATAVAVPGTSEHELGLAADIYSSENMDLDESQVNTFTQQWLMEHCWEYGFILRYPNGKSSITGIIFEPWHYRYVGREYAEKIYNADVCLEEYLDQAEHPYSPLDPFAETAEDTEDEDESQSEPTDGAQDGFMSEPTDGTGDGFMSEPTDGTGEGSFGETQDGTGEGSFGETQDGTGDGSLNGPTDGTGDGFMSEPTDGSENGFMNPVTDGAGDGSLNEPTDGSENGFMNPATDGAGDGFMNQPTDGTENRATDETYGGTYNGY